MLIKNTVTNSIGFVYHYVYKENSKKREKQPELLSTFTSFFNAVKYFRHRFLSGRMEYKIIWKYCAENEFYCF